MTGPSQPPVPIASTSPSALRRILKRLTGPAGIYLLTGVLTRVGFILLIPLYSRRLTEAEYGDYGLAQTAMNIAPAFVLGLPAAQSLFYFDSPDREQSRKRVGAVAKLTVLVTLCVAILAQLIIATVVPSTAVGLFAPRSLTCVVVASGGSVLAMVPVQFLRDALKPLAAAAFQLAEFLLIVGTGILFVMVLGRGFPGSLEALALTYAVLGAASVVFIYAYLGGKLTWPISKQAFSFSIPWIAHYLALWVQGVSDRWAMKLAGLGKSLGPYSLASQLSNPSTMVVGAWNLERSPRTGELYREGGVATIRREFRAIVQSYVVAAAVPSVLIVAGTPLLRFFISSSFYSALMYLPLLLVVNFIDALYHPSFQVVYYDSKSRWISTVTGISALASIALSVVLVPIFGVWGALLSRGAASIVRTSAIWYAARRCFRLDEARRNATLTVLTPS